MKHSSTAFVAGFLIMMLFLLGCEESDDSSDSANTNNQPTASQPVQKKDPPPAASVFSPYYGNWEGASPFVYNGTNCMANAGVTLESSALPTGGVQDVFTLVITASIPDTSPAEWVVWNWLNLGPFASWAGNELVISAPGMAPGNTVIPFTITFADTTSGVVEVPSLYGGLSINITKQ
jgi:hypothetical protein